MMNYDDTYSMYSMMMMMMMEVMVWNLILTIMMRTDVGENDGGGKCWEQGLIDHCNNSE